MGGLLIKTIRGLAEVNGTSEGLNGAVTGFGLLLFMSIATFVCLWAVVRLAKWAWTHPL